MGKFQVANSQTVIHGYLKPNPEGPVEQGAFTPGEWKNCVKTCTTFS